MISREIKNKAQDLTSMDKMLDKATMTKSKIWGTRKVVIDLGNNKTAKINMNDLVHLYEQKFNEAVKKGNLDLKALKNIGERLKELDESKTFKKSTLRQFVGNEIVAKILYGKKFDRKEVLSRIKAQQKAQQEIQTSVHKIIEKAKQQTERTTKDFPMKLEAIAIGKEIAADIKNELKKAAQKLENAADNFHEKLQAADFGKEVENNIKGILTIAKNEMAETIKNINSWKQAREAEAILDHIQKEAESEAALLGRWAKLTYAEREAEIKEIVQEVKEKIHDIVDNAKKGVDKLVRDHKREQAYRELVEKTKKQVAEQNKAKLAGGKTEAKPPKADYSPFVGKPATKPENPEIYEDFTGYESSEDSEISKEIYGFEEESIPSEESTNLLEALDLHGAEKSVRPELKRSASMSSLDSLKTKKELPDEELELKKEEEALEKEEKLLKEDLKSHDANKAFGKIEAMIPGFVKRVEDKNLLKRLNKGTTGTVHHPKEKKISSVAQEKQKIGVAYQALVKKLQEFNLKVNFDLANALYDAENLKKLNKAINQLLQTIHPDKAKDPATAKKGKQLADLKADLKDLEDANEKLEKGLLPSSEKKKIKAADTGFQKITDLSPEELEDELEEVKGAFEALEAKNPPEKDGFQEIAEASAKKQKQLAEKEKELAPEKERIKHLPRFKALNTELGKVFKGGSNELFDSLLKHGVVKDLKEINDTKLQKYIDNIKLLGAFALSAKDPSKRINLSALSADQIGTIFSDKFDATAANKLKGKVTLE